MATVRQMAELYLRGSLANVTMKNLTPEQVIFAEELTCNIAKHPEMRKHKKIKKVLADTIRADYKSDPESADQEFKIAIWRGVVNLFFHKHYKFQCTACGATHRNIKTTGQMKPLDQAHTPCPVCNQIKIKNPGETSFTTGQIINFDDFQDSYKTFQRGIPTFDSTIEAIPGGGYNEETLNKLLAEKKITQKVYERRLQQFRYDDPESIIQDENQMTKFFGEFVWGYFKQQIRENKRPESQKKPTQIIGNADEIITQEIISSATKLKIPIIFCPKTQPENGWWHIGVIGLQTPPEFTYELIPIILRASEARIKILIEPTEIKIEHAKNSKQLKALVKRPEHIMVIDNNQSIDEKEIGQFSIDQISFKTIGGSKMELIDDTEKIDRIDVMEAIKNSLPDGDCQKIFEILKQDGDYYEGFRETFQYDTEPKQAHIAKFLNITTRRVKYHMSSIKLVCLTHQFTPSSLK